MSLPRRALIRLLPSLAAVLVAWSPASAGAPTDRLRGFFASVNEVLTDPTTEHRPLERVARIRLLVTNLTDIPSAAADALGPEWLARSAAEREEFAELFAELLERAYVGRLAGAVRVTGVVTLTYVDEVLESDAATVTTKVSGTQGQVEYRMTLRGGRWRVRDIVLDGVSVVDNYRAQFKRLLQNDAFPKVMTAMRAKLAAESLLFAGLPRRAAPQIVLAPSPESQAIVAAPPRPDEEPWPLPPPRVVDQPNRTAPRPVKVVTAPKAPTAQRSVTAVTAPTVQRSAPAVVASAVVAPAPRASAATTTTPAPAGSISAPATAASISTSAPVQGPAESSAMTIVIVVVAALLGMGLGGIAYRYFRRKAT